ncbi:type III restriction-modification enzyme, R/helicase subunit [Candidatus Vecturithrix granuli]|uniref:Type III restriction-modification enzyme, R/helicase subunit n=1 Tax=Vecturithrix granuli TaxID=1499967 RepID=A0A081C7P0_VECG1|nr:type III restriction-modification enzyme, R/helicase subunit [Candidatus Vecturithrix granuli]
MANEPIENPVINSPFAEPLRHFRFSDAGITNEIAPGRRKSVYFIPIAKPKQRSSQLSLQYEQQSEARENRLINELREKVAPWRRADYPGVSYTTRRLLEYWQRAERERRLFFCQIEALEIIIYLTELGRNADLNYFENQLREANANATPEGHAPLPRIAFKMATGSGKTVVMAMLIAWHTLNKLADRQARKFSDAFLIVTPGLTIRDRLRVLLPNDPDNYYQRLDLTPPSMFADLGQAKILIANYHAFLLHEHTKAGKLTKTLLTPNNAASPFTETPGQMVRRVCGAFGGKKGIIVINDEAHHCYHPKPDDRKIKPEDVDLKELESLEEEARVWINGLEAIQQKIGVRAIYDLSATPFFLRSSGYNEGMLFPWVVSDFSLTDAIESSIVKVPRVPVADNTAQAEDLIYRNLWKHIRKDIPKGTRRKEDEGSEPTLPKELQGALHSLYSHYEKTYKLWEQARLSGATDAPPPVFIIVCNNTRTSKTLFDYAAGYEKIENGAPVLVPGKLPLFSNVEESGAITERRWSTRPSTLLIDSQQLESGESLSAEFKTAAQREIEEFKDELRVRYPGRDVTTLTDEELLREVMNTVGKPGKLGEQIKCVVSVSMLTEGWDCSTVTHILGVRAFGTQLLCEQVVGRGLRRMSYEPETHTVEMDGTTFEFQAFPVEYAEVYGVPFEFIPAAGKARQIPGPVAGIRVQSLTERAASRITFPRVMGYCHEFGSERLSAHFDESARYTLTPRHLPTFVETAPIVGETSFHGLYDLQQRRMNEVAFFLARLVLEQYFRQSDDPSAGFIGNPAATPVKPWLFPQLLAIVKTWLDTCLICKDQTFPQMLLIHEYAHTAADRIYHGIAHAMSAESRLKPLLHPVESVGSTDEVNFLTRKPVYLTNAKCPLSHIVLDSGWERNVAQALEHLPQVQAYVKNAHLDFTIPYTYQGQDRRYTPDFIAKVDDGRGAGDLLHLVIEVSGEPRDDKAAKVSTIKNLWIPAVNNSGQFGRWAYLEITDPYQAISGLQAFLENYRDFT